MILGVFVQEIKNLEKAIDEAKGDMVRVYKPDLERALRTLKNLLEVSHDEWVEVLGD